MSSQAIGHRFMVSRGGCWQCRSDCRCWLAEGLTLFQVAPNVPQVVAVAFAWPTNCCYGLAYPLLEPLVNAAFLTL